MDQGLSDVLLIGENQRGWSQLVKALERLRCRCWFASTVEEVRILLKRHPFRLILSTRPVTDRGALMLLLRGPGRNIYYSVLTEDSCLWFRAFPEIVDGQRLCAVRPAVFMRTLNDLIARLSSSNLRISVREARSCRRLRGNVQPRSAGGVKVAAATTAE